MSGSTDRFSLRSSPRRAFTLVEILIVVVILGILAAVVIPQFTNASTDASSASLRSQLHAIRSQIELYRVRHQGVLPPLGQTNDVSDWDALVAPLDEPAYLQGAPYNSFTGSAGISDAEGVDVGWVWDPATGLIFAPYFDEITGIYSPP